MTRKKKALIIILSVLVTIFIILPGIGIAVLKWGILPPEKLTPLVLKHVSYLVEGEVGCERIELTFAKTFPQVGLRITNGSIITFEHPDSLTQTQTGHLPADTLLSFSEAVVTVNIMDYFKRNRVTVERLTLRDPFFHGYIDAGGNANWNILKDNGEEKAETDENDGSLPLIDLQFIGIRNGHFIYDDRPSDLYTEVKGFNLRMRNKLSKGSLNTDLKTGFESIVFDSPAYSLENDVTLTFESKLDLSRGQIEFSGSKLVLNELPFVTEGKIIRAGENLDLDISFALNADNLGDMIAFIPDIYFRNKKKTVARGELSLRGKVNGTFGDSIMPNVLFNCSLDNGYLSAKGSKHGIEKLDTDISLFYHGMYPDSSYVTFRKLEMQGSNTSFSGSGHVSNLMTDPYVDAKVKGRIDFEGIMADIFNPDSILVKGILNADIEAGFRVWEMMDGDFTRLRAAGKFNMDRMVMADRISGTTLFMKGVTFTADTTRQTSSYLTGNDLISAHISVDTLSLRSGEEINSRIGRLDMRLKTSLSFDTTAVMPVTTNITMQSMRTRLPDSVWVSGQNIVVRGGIKASDSDRKKGMFGGQITMDTLRYFDIPARTGGTIDNCTFNVEMLPLRDAMRQRRTADGTTSGERRGRSDSTVVRERSVTGALRERRNSGDSIAVRAGRSGAGGGATGITGSGGSGATSSEGFSKGLLRKWEVRGSLSLSQMRMFTPIFPLPIRMEETTLRFDTDKINLSEAKLHVGKSELVLTGELNSMRQAMLRGGVLKGNLALRSDYIDCNQLIAAINRSSLFTASEVPIDDEEASIKQWEQEDLAGVDEPDDLEDYEGLFIVPDNIDLVLRTNIRKMDFRDVELEKIRGEIIVRNQTVNLRRLNMGSNIGSGNLTMVYATKSPEKAEVGFELELGDIIVERLIGMFPSIDSLLPMLRSFEGVLDCQMSATCELDSAMNVLLPTLHSACYLTGENMVLLDGETFAEISKKLMFKNKEKNIIDYISVDLSIKDNKVEIFPFKVDIDRYKLAVGGIHNLDMTFDYHVSVLKSPVPFKLGIDIKGNLDDFKFKVVKCRYKDMFKVAREQELQDTRLNLRTAIRESIRKQLMENAPELGEGYTHERIRSRRPETAVTDMDADVELDGTEDEEESPAIESEFEGLTPGDSVRRALTNEGEDPHRGTGDGMLSDVEQEPTPSL